MYNFITYYAIFAITTGITGYFTIYKPILDFIKDEYGEVHPVIEHPKSAALILIIIGSITAPFILKVALFGPSEELIEEIITKFIGND